MAPKALLVTALLVSACASIPAPDLHAIRAPTSKPSTDGHAPVPTRSIGEKPRLDPVANAIEQERAGLSRRIRASRASLIVGAAILVTGTAILTTFLVAGAPDSRYDDGNDGFEFLYGAIPMGAGALTMVISGYIFATNQQKLRMLAQPQRPTLRMLPSLSASAHSSRAGVLLDLSF